MAKTVANEDDEINTGDEAPDEFGDIELERAPRPPRVKHGTYMAKGGQGKIVPYRDRHQLVALWDFLGIDPATGAVRPVSLPVRLNFRLTTNPKTGRLRCTIGPESALARALDLFRPGARVDRIPRDLFKNRWADIRVGAVTSDWKKDPLAPDSQYEKVQAIVRVYPLHKGGTPLPSLAEPSLSLPCPPSPPPPQVKGVEVPKRAGDSRRRLAAVPRRNDAPEVFLALDPLSPDERKRLRYDADNGDAMARFFLTMEEKNA